MARRLPTQWEKMHKRGLHINSEQINPFLAPDYSVSQLAISEWFIITPIHNFLIDFGKLPRDSYSICSR